jgi:hypothetical protein
VENRKIEKSMSYYVLELFFDVETERSIRNIWQVVDDMPGWSPLERGDSWPHLSISSTPQLDLDMFGTLLRENAAAASAVPVQLATVETFTPDLAVVYLAPIKTPGLFSIHAQLIDVLLLSGAVIPDLYAPGVWVPHCTVAMQFPLALVRQTVELIYQQKLPIAGTIDRVGLVEISPLGASYVAVCPLAG